MKKKPLEGLRRRISQAIWAHEDVDPLDEVEEALVIAVAQNRALKSELRRALHQFENDFDGVPCRYDHHGCCQEHWWESPCQWPAWRERVRALLGLDPA